MKEIVVKGKLETKDVLSFLLHHNYTSIGGMLTGILGVIGLIAAPIFFLSGDNMSGAIFTLFAFMYVIYTPLGFFSKASLQMRTNPVFKNEMTFKFTEEQLKVKLYTGVTAVEWKQIVKVVVSKKHIYIYIQEANALIIPKSNFSSEEDIKEVEAFVIEKQLSLNIKKRLDTSVDVKEDI